VEEFVACGVWLLGAGANFDQISVGVTPVSKLKVPLPNFAASHRDDDDDVKFPVRVESDAKVIVGSYTHLEHDAYNVGQHNGGCLNHVLELVEVAYGPHPVPGYDAFAEGLKKRKADSIGKALVKRPKAPEKKKADTAKASTPRGKISLK
jgi:hypothetical protein